MYLPNTQEEPFLPRTAYTERGGERLMLESVSSSLTADYAIVGGGLVGCSAAMHLAEQGKSVVLIEANEIGWGAAGRSAGHVAPHATKLSPQKLVEVYGPVYGRRLAKIGADAPAFVEQLAARLGIDVSLVKGGILTAAHSRAATGKLQAWADTLQRSGLPVEYLSAQDTAAIVGSEFYKGSMIERSGIAINPLAWVRGIARAAIANGAKLYEHTHMRNLAPTGNGWRVTTDHGEVEAGTVLLCTNAYTDDTWPGLKRSIIPVRGYMGWTKRVPDAVRESILRGIAAMIDTRKMPVAMRLNNDGRLQFGMEAGFGAPHVPDIEGILRKLQEVTPQLKGIEIDGYWNGWVTRGIADGWRIHQLAPNVVTAIGCNGRGVAMGPIMGRELASYVTGTPAEDLAVPLTPVKPIAWYPFHQLLGRTAVRAFRAMDALVMRTGR